MALKAELTGLKAMNSGAVTGAAGLQQITYTVAGNMVIIPTLATAGQAIRMQNDCVGKLIGIIEKLLEKS